jgi:hypothetical protein
MFTFHFFAVRSVIADSCAQQQYEPGPDFDKQAAGKGQFMTVLWTISSDSAPGQWIRSAPSKSGVGQASAGILPAG